MTALELASASKTYSNIAVLRNVNLLVEEGEIHALVGLNGAGKTTIMRLLVGIVRPTSGSVKIRGRDVASLAARDWTGIGHLIESPLAYPELTVAQNLWASGRLAGLSSAAARASAAKLADELLLTAWWSRRSKTLSLGNRQRLGLAAALIADPSIVILDEPTNALDPAGVVAVREALLRRVRETGMTVLVSSHHLDEVSRIADRISVINAGRMIGTLEPDEIDIERRFFALVYADVEATE
jgi:ABC-2 type transport system ATP-binding protein